MPSGRDICKQLGGHWRAHQGMCRCPAHQDGTPSLSVSETRDGRVLVHCHGGCSQLAVIGALRSIGLWGNGELVTDPSYPAYLTTKQDDIRSSDERQRRAQAQEIWDRASPIKGTRAESYLKARGIRFVSDQLRYMASQRHSTARKSFPVLIARLSDNNGLCAIQRTFLDPQQPAKADIKPNKMTLGPMGQGAVRLFPALTVLGIAEGIETALSAAQMYRLPVWASLSANRLSKLEIPPTVHDVIIFADPGDVGVKEAFAAQDHYEAKGLRVEVITPQAHFKGNAKADFNDHLREGA